MLSLVIFPKKVPFFQKQCYFMVFLGKTTPKVHFLKDSRRCPKILHYTLAVTKTLLGWHMPLIWRRWSHDNTAPLKLIRTNGYRYFLYTQNPWHYWKDKFYQTYWTAFLKKNSLNGQNGYYIKIILTAKKDLN